LYARGADPIALIKTTKPDQLRHDQSLHDFVLGVLEDAGSLKIDPGLLQAGLLVLQRIASSPRIKLNACSLSRVGTATREGEAIGETLTRNQKSSGNNGQHDASHTAFLEKIANFLKHEPT
jgi:hypothetical protein